MVAELALTRTLPVLLVLASLLPTVSATHDPNDFFTDEAVFTGIQWNDIHGTSATNLFTVGQTAVGASAIAYRGSGTWVLQSVPNIGPLTQVWVGSASLAFAVTNQPFLSSANWALKWDGASWTAINPSSLGDTFTSRGVFGLSTTSVSFIYTTVNGGVRWVYWNGATFTDTGSCTVDVDHGDFVYATASRFLTWGSGLVTETTATRMDLQSPYTSCAQQTRTTYSPKLLVRDSWDSTNTLAGTWSVGESGLILKGTTSQSSPTMEDMETIWGTAETNIWAAGAGGNIIHYDGTSWTNEDGHETTTDDATGNYCSDAANCWIVFETGRIQKLQVNAAVALPSLAGFAYDPDNLQTTVSHSQCLGDKVALAANHEPAVNPGAGDILNRYIIDVMDNIVLLTNWATNNLNNKLYYSQLTLPSGQYQYLVTVDRGGLGMDVYMGSAFTVPAGSCLTAAEKEALESLIGNVQDTLSDEHAAQGTGGSFIQGTTLGGTTVENVLLLLLIFLVCWYVWAKSVTWEIKFLMPLIVALLFLATLTFVDKWPPITYLAAIFAVGAGAMTYRTSWDFIQTRRDRRARARAESSEPRLT
jgi:hypothetical protein